MKHTVLKWIAVFLILFLCTGEFVLAQPQPCSSMPYLHQNKFDPKPIKLAELTGTVVDQNGTALPQLCIGIFSSQDHRLLRYTQADSHGSFTLDTKGLPDADYRLVGQLLGFCPANAIIDVNAHFRHKKPLVVHMNLPSNTACSYVDVKKESH
jgi:hypothetical protein